MRYTTALILTGFLFTAADVTLLAQKGQAAHATGKPDTAKAPKTQPQGSAPTSTHGKPTTTTTTDTHGKPTCTDDPSYHCIKAWPALKTASAPHAGAGVRQSLLGVAKRTDGGVQVTYNHHPLYYFHGGADYGAGDKTPGDIYGQGFAGIWFVVAPNGTPIRF